MTSRNKRAASLRPILYVAFGHDLNSIEAWENEFWRYTRVEALADQVEESLAWALDECESRFRENCRTSIIDLREWTPAMCKQITDWANFHKVDVEWHWFPSQEDQVDPAWQMEVYEHKG